MAPTRPRLVLASTSRYRRGLLERLGIPFTVASPGVDETPLAGELPGDLASRLAGAKARAVAAQHPGAVVIGSDQVAELDGGALGKPGTAAIACAQLRAASGRAVIFRTAVLVIGADGREHSHTDLTTVRFRTLSTREIARYVELDQPLDCAGSFRSEGLGIALFEAIETTDPSALVGLPLAWVAAALKESGLDPLAPAGA
jgi:septum formation protein